MDLGTRYSPEKIEAYWYERWVENGYFSPKGSGEPFVIVIPPPNITGRIHMGHALNMTLQDILVRYKRMRGYDVLWVPGEDHAGIATQNVIEKNLESQGINRKDLGREKFIEIAWDWTRKYRNEIRRQVKALGASVDWTRERFTLDQGLSRAVRKVFVELYNKGLIYRGEYMVNWCPRCKTVLSDEEVEHKEHESKLYYVKYPIKGTSDFIVVATTRPETMLGDTAIAVHPKDERYKHLVGKVAILPILNRELPIIADEYVDPEFGTGAVKITPAHDPNDFEIATRHNLPSIAIFDEEARVNESGSKYEGLDRYEARQKILIDLDEGKYLEKVEDLIHSVGHCYRCGSAIEPRIMDQWFVRMKPLAKKAIEVVEQDEVKFFPSRWKNVYLKWMYEIRDWCISRQLWWGHRIPVWYCDRCGETIASEDDVDTCPKCAGPLRQDEDVLDTWFSSALWPFSTLGWPERTEDLDRYYPTSVLVTGFDIIFFWVARMIVMGYEFMHDKPFSDVYIHQLIRDKQGRKMSKSLGNGIDPIDMVEKYGSDPMRFTLAILAAQGSDIKLDERNFETYRRFANKIWNATRFVLMNLKDFEECDISNLKLVDMWILSRFQKTVEDVSTAIENYEFNVAARSVYEFFWNEFCDWYIEAVKSRLESSERRLVQNVLVKVLDGSLRLLHPFMPFVSEELWQKLPVSGESIVVAPWPKVDKNLINEGAEKDFRIIMNVVRGIRNVRSEMNIPPKKPLKIFVVGEGFDEEEKDYIMVLAQAAQILEASRKPSSCVTAYFDDVREIYVELDNISLKTEIQRLKKKLEKLIHEKERYSNKLKDSKFLNNAPREAVEQAKEKLLNAEERVKTVKRILDDFA